MLSGGKAVAQNFEFMKRAKRAFTNWPKPEVVLKDPDNVFCHVRKLPLTNPKFDRLAEEIVTFEHDKKLVGFLWHSLQIVIYNYLKTSEYLPTQIQSGVQYLSKLKKKKVDYFKKDLKQLNKMAN